MRKTFAISRRDDPMKVDLWCYREEGQSFHVINGLWGGTFVEGGFKIGRTGETFPASIAWEGEVPEAEAHDYNAAIAWIEEQLSARVGDL